MTPPKAICYSVNTYPQFVTLRFRDRRTQLRSVAEIPSRRHNRSCVWTEALSEYPVRMLLIWYSASEHSLTRSNRQINHSSNGGFWLEIGKQGRSQLFRLVVGLADFQFPHILKTARMTSTHWPHQHFELLIKAFWLTPTMHNLLQAVEWPNQKFVRPVTPRGSVLIKVFLPRSQYPADITLDSFQSELWTTVPRTEEHNTR